MKTDYTDITLVLDRSGSMEAVRSDTIGGFNAFLKDQQNAGVGTATITLVQFDDIYEPVYRAIALTDAPPLTTKTFVPRGSTALLDAVGQAITETGARLAALPEAERPDKVIFVILTDGQENASHKCTMPQISDMIRHQRDTYNWEFVFLGANQDAIATAAQIGVNAEAALTYAHDGKGVLDAMETVSENVRAMRSKAQPGFAIKDSDRAKQRR